jgi:hypothetical protein
MPDFASLTPETSIAKRRILCLHEGYLSGQFFGKPFIVSIEKSNVPPPGNLHARIAGRGSASIANLPHQMDTWIPSRE